MNETQNPRSAVPSPKSWQLHFEVPIAPCGKARARATKNRHYTPLETKAAQRTIANVARREMRLRGLEKLDCPVSLYVVACFKNHEKLHEYAMCKPDWDNIGKLVSDALNDVAWNDDCQVVDANILKQYDLFDRFYIVVKPKREIGYKP